MSTEPMTDESGAIHFMNAALCEFAMRWLIDGDYMRCRVSTHAPPTRRAAAMGEQDLPAGAPAAQQPLHESANITGVATGSRNDSACESVTLGSLPATIIAGSFGGSPYRELDELHMGIRRAIDEVRGRASLAAVIGVLRLVEHEIIREETEAPNAD